MSDAAAPPSVGSSAQDRPADELDSRRGWLVALGTFIATATIFAITYSFTTFLSAMSAEFDSGNGSTALMFGLTIFFLFMLGLPAGRASDRYGPRPMVALGCTFMVGGLLLTSIVDRISIGYVTYGFGIGVGVACSYVPLVAQVSGWFDKRRSAALGFAVSGIGIGTLVGPPLANELIELYGWRQSYRIFAAIAFVGLLAAFALVKGAPVRADEQPLDLRAVVRTPIFQRLYVGGLLMTLSLFVPFVFLKPYAEDRGISSAAGAALISFLGLGSLVGRIGLGALAAKVGVLRLYQISFAVVGGSYLIWLFAGSSYVALAIFAMVLGTAYGGYVALSPAASAELFGLSGLGAVLGALYTAGGIGGLAGPPIAGWLIDITDSYQAAIIFAMVLGLVSVAVVNKAIGEARTGTVATGVGKQTNTTGSN